METTGTVVAVISNHEAAEGAVKELAGSGFEIKNLSVVGKGYHTDEKVVGFYNLGDRVKFWGILGRFLGAVLWRTCHDDPRHWSRHRARLFGYHDDLRC